MFDLRDDIGTGRSAKDSPALVLDMAHLRTQALGDETLVVEVLSMFMDQSADMLRAVRDARSPADRRDAAHRLKGSARAIGAFRVAQRAEHLEFLPDEQDEDVLLDAVAGLHAAVAEVLSTIAGTLDDSSRPGL